MTQIQVLKYISLITDRNPEAAFQVRVSGGAIRDTDYGKRLKDIDIFCLYPSHYSEEQLTTWVQSEARSLGGVNLVRVNPENDYETNFNGIHSVWNFRLVYENHWYDCQFILQQNDAGESVERQIMNKFDLTVSQALIKLDPTEDAGLKYVVVKSEGYKQSKLDNTIRLTDFGKAQTPEHRRKTKDRAQRFSTKLDLAIELRWNDGEVYSAVLV